MVFPTTTITSQAESPEMTSVCPLLDTPIVISIFSVGILSVVVSVGMLFPHLVLLGHPRIFPDPVFTLPEKLLPDSVLPDPVISPLPEKFLSHGVNPPDPEKLPRALPEKPCGHPDTLPLLLAAIRAPNIPESRARFT